MNRFGEFRALLMAIAAATLAVGLTFGFAATVRREFYSAKPAPAPVTVLLPLEATQGRHLFSMNCAHCHGDDARGDEGPDLYDLRKSDDRIHTIITAGIKGEMPSFAKKLGDEDIRALTAYLRTLKS